MASPYSYHSAATTTAAAAPRGISPAISHMGRATSQSPSRTPYNPAAYQGGMGMRRPSASPMRTLQLDHPNGDLREQYYNPQNYGPVAGNGGEFLPNNRPLAEDAPPPYSPGGRIPSGGIPGGRQSLHVTPPHHRHSAFPSTPASPTSAQPTPSTATAHGIFSPYTDPHSASTANTTPLSPGNSSWFNRRRGYSPPSAPLQYASNTPTALQHSTTVSSTPPPPASASPSGNAAPPVPPPPPGPPPLNLSGQRSASVSGPCPSPRHPPPPAPGSQPRSASISVAPPPASARSEARAQGGGAIPPPPPGPPPSRTNSIRRAAAGLTSVFSRPRSQLVGSMVVEDEMSDVEEEVPPVPALPPNIPPKRKIEEEGGNYRDKQRASPKQVEEENRQREGESNNPFRSAVKPTMQKASPPRISPPPLQIPPPPERMSPLIDLTSPQERRDSGLRRKQVSPTLVARQQLPTPPPQHSSPTSPGADMVDRGMFMRMETDRTGTDAGPEVGPSAPRDLGKGVLENDEGFMGITRRRYKEMLIAEDAAATEAAKLKHFLRFLTKECKMRKEMYAGGADPLDLKRLVKVTAVLTSDPPSVAPMSPRDEELVMGERSSRRGSREQWWGHSGLSGGGLASPTTIADVSAYEARIRDEESSRGRTSSRWWETSGESVSESMAVRSDGLGDEGDSTFFGRRSGRHSKTPRASLREIAEYVSSPRVPGAPNPRDAASYVSSQAFPPDRKGKSASRSRSRPAALRPRRTVKTSLDIAPLLTLLPPYPGEFPAVNNSHPQLEVFRSLVRTLNQLEGLKHMQDEYNTWLLKRKEERGVEALRRRNSQAERIQKLYNTPGKQHIDFGAVESLNLAFEAEEAGFRQQALQEDFDEFAKRVVDHAHRDLHERITAAAAAYVDLQALIESTARPLSTEQEPPELLEKLTALKWIFDVRELLHKHVFELLNARNNKYKALVLTPLLDARASDRIASAEEFFANDEKTRKETFSTERTRRYEEFSALVETQVTRGVEAARSTYWDVAPLVQESLTKIPKDLTNVVPLVPPEEFIEHPELLDKPIVYLDRKMKDAEKSMYSLVEAQTELLCLLHGVKSAAKEDEEARLTADLKEKVQLIEDEWQEGLGGTFKGLRIMVEGEVEKREKPNEQR